MLLTHLTRLLDRRLSDTGAELRQEHGNDQQTGDPHDPKQAGAVRDRKQQASSRHHADREDQNDTNDPEGAEEVDQHRARERTQEDADETDEENGDGREPVVRTRKPVEQSDVATRTDTTQDPEDQDRNGKHDDRKDRHALPGKDPQRPDHHTGDPGVPVGPAEPGVGLNVVRRVVCGGHDDHLLSDKWSCMDSCLIPFSSQCASLNAQSRSNGKTKYILSYLC